MKPIIQAVHANSIELGDFIVRPTNYSNLRSPKTCLEEVKEVTHFHNSFTSRINGTVWTWEIPGEYEEPDHWCEECGSNYEDCLTPAPRYFDVLRFK